MLYQTVNPHGGDLYGRPVVLDFSANTNPLGTPDAVRRAVIDAVSRLDRYPDPYCRALVQAIARFEQVPEDWILCGCGAAELIFSYCMAARPERALELAPTFSEYSTALEAVGCRIDRYPLTPDNGFVLGEAFLSYLEAGAWDVLFLCNPNNPTGQIIERDLLGKIVRLCREKHIRLFLDECFLDLTDGGREQSMKEYLNRFPGLFILKAFTKSYGMAGLRLGYCLTADPALLTGMSRAVQPWNVSIPAQAAGVAALEETAFLRNTRQIIREERQWLCQQLCALGITVNPSCANYLLLHCSAPLQEKLMERGILIRSCANYHGLDAGWYRIAVKTRQENQVLISALTEILEER